MQERLYEDDIIVQNMADFLRIFGEYWRIRILECIMDIKYTVTEISKFTGLSVSAVSHQLKLLKKEKLVVATRDGKYLYYIVSDKHVKEIYKSARKHIEEFKKDITIKEEEDEMYKTYMEDLKDNL